MGTLQFLQQYFAFFFLLEIKFMLVCDSLRIKWFFTFFAVFLCPVVCWLKIYLIFLFPRETSITEEKSLLGISLHLVLYSVK